MFNILLMLLPLLGSVSTDSYPEVLSLEEEEKYLALWQQKDENARNILIEHNLRLVAHIVKKFENTKEDKDDLLSIGAFGLIKAVDSYKFESNTRLATYASKCIENEILMYLRKTQKIRQEVSLDEVLTIDNEGNEMMLEDVLCSTEPLAIDNLTKEEDLENLHFALSKLTRREKQIMELRFGLDGNKPLTQKEVADLLGISQSYISRLEKKIIEKMRFIISTKVGVA